MGRWSTGAVTTREVMRIELSYLLKKEFIKKNCKISGTLSWSNDSRISFATSYNTDAGNYIQLIYTVTDREGIKTNHDYKIQLDTVPSNIGKGEVLYFICPESGRRCRILYKAYGCLIWKARATYRNRIYYPCQASSKMEYPNSRYWTIEREIEELHKRKRKQYTYRGKPTKFALRMEKLQQLWEEYDQLRFSPAFMPKSLRGMWGNYRP